MNRAIQLSAAPVTRAASTRADVAKRALGAGGLAWLTVALIGQLIFALYVAGFYGSAAAQDRLADWTKVLSQGHVPGDFFGNAMIWLHLIFTVAIIVGGALQLIPRIRRAAPVFHRVNGRIYLAAAAVLSITGLVMMWTRGTFGDVSQHVGTSLNGVLIVVFAAVAWRHARARAFDAHRRWALRLFLAVSGVWFFRIGLMLWLLIHRAPVGFNPKTFEGPFLTFLAFAQFLIPLALLELYLRAQKSGSATQRWIMVALLGVATVATAAGVAGAAAMMWLPRI